MKRINKDGRPKQPLESILKHRVPCRRREERGAVLILFVLISFAFLSMATLIIDLGHVFLARRQMVNAAESAALDGLRFGAADPQMTEVGRVEAKATVERHFGQHDGIVYGAGPNIELQGGIELPGTDFRASQLIDAETLGPFEPAPLQLNFPNVRAGDLVVGEYIEEVDGEPPSHGEQPNYQREDFIPYALPQTPQENSALLVRMRRTGSVMVDGILSSGPYVPFLFGRGGVLSVEEDADRPAAPGALSDRRARGTAVRATAIASLVPATVVGAWTPRDATPFDRVNPRNFFGLAPFVLRHPRLAKSGDAISFEVVGDQLRVPATGNVAGWLVQSTLLSDPLNSDELGQMSFTSDLPINLQEEEEGTEVLVRIGREVILTETINHRRRMRILLRDVWRDYHRDEEGEDESDRAIRLQHSIGARVDFLSPSSVGLPVAIMKSRWDEEPVENSGTFIVPVTGAVQFGTDQAQAVHELILGYVVADVRILSTPSRIEVRPLLRNASFINNVGGNYSGFAEYTRRIWASSTRDPESLQVLLADAINQLMQQRETFRQNAAGNGVLLAPALRRAVR